MSTLLKFSTGSSKNDGFPPKKSYIRVSRGLIFRWTMLNLEVSSWHLEVSSCQEARREIVAATNRSAKVASYGSGEG